jgi:hypothetical protein
MNCLERIAWRTIPILLAAMGLVLIITDVVIWRTL